MLDYFTAPARRAHDGPKPRSISERFWLKIKKTDSCWLWIGGCFSNGYGQIGSGPGCQQKLLAHRVSWEMHFGEIPDGMEVCHNCPGGDNPRCVNPAHLFLGNHLANVHDSIAKGRMRRGSHRHSAKLTEDIVRECRTRHAAGGVTYKQLADEFGVHEMVICKAVLRYTWKHVI